MKIEFTKEEVEQILVNHANSIVKTGEKPFNKVECHYSHIPATATVVREEPKEEAA